MQNKGRWNILKAVAFSGYRPEKFPFELREDLKEYIELVNMLREEITGLINKGYSTFYIGGCDGFDLLVGEILNQLKYIYDIKIIVAMPYKDFGNKFSNKWKEILYLLLENSYRIIYVNEKYSYGCYQKRNELMVDNSNVLVVYYDGQKGGTLNTIRYANNKGVEIINIFSKMENNFFY